MAEAGKVRIFVSHHHSPDEDLFTKRLVADLVIAGADVWVDDQRISSDNFVRKISEGLTGRQWLVLVMTPHSVASSWVRNEVDTALNEVTNKRMLGVIPILMTPTPDQDIPILWRPLHRYDATRTYEPARDALLRAIGLNVPTPAPWPISPTPSTRLNPSSSTPSGPVPPILNRPPVPTVPAPAPRFPPPVVPARLASLGYAGINVTGRPTYIPPLIIIPAGPFLMGSDQTRDAMAGPDETPLQWVETGAFQIAKYPVTVTEYALAVRAGVLSEPPQGGNITWQAQLQRPDHPVVCVTWANAVAYIAWLREATGQPGWRLPTEAEWEKAARWDQRANSSRIYPWGDTFEKQRCNAKDSGLGTTTPVGSYPASDARRNGSSPYGVEDMVGNVWEWTSSLYKPYPYVFTDGREDLKSPDNRSVRGGSWNDAPALSRAAYRLSKGPDSVHTDLCFRLVLSPSIA